MRLRPREQRGFVMLVMLAVLLMLLVVASLMFTRASAATYGSAALSRQAVAQDRALMGMQRAIGELTATVPTSGIIAFEANTANDCIFAVPDACVADPMFTRVTINGGPGPLDLGGGLQYAYEFFWWRPNGVMSPPGERLKVIRAIGYSGFALPPSPNTFDSEVLIEVGGGTSGSGSGPGGYAGN